MVAPVYRAIIRNLSAIRSDDARNGIEDIKQVLQQIISATPADTINSIQGTLDEIRADGDILGWNEVLVYKDYTAGDAGTIYADATAGNLTVTLPRISDTERLRAYFVKKVDSTVNTVTVAGSGPDLIDASGSYTISTQYVTVLVRASRVWERWAIM